MLRQRGFTLIELLIVIAIGVILATVGFTNLYGYRQHQSVRLTAQGAVGFLREAQNKSTSREGGVNWGVRFYEPSTGRDSYYLFTNPATPISQVAFPGGVELDPASGPFPKDIIFNRNGLPASPTTLIIRLSNNPSVTQTITINAQGTISQN